MRIRFVDRDNFHINQLVQTCWDQHDSHVGETFRLLSRSEEERAGLINDSEQTSAETDIESPEERTRPRPLDLSRFGQPQPTQQTTPERVSPRRLLIAVDGGIVNLGEFMGGATAFAVRGAAIVLIENELIVLRYNTGALLIDENNRVPVFRYIGHRLGNEELYLARTESGRLVPRPSAFETPNQIQDRCRNFVERMIQEEALGILLGNGAGLLLLDGALPAGTFDTPLTYLEDFLRTAANGSVDVAAVSKKSSVSLAGRHISDLFDDDPSFVGYLPLKEAIRMEREQLVDKGLAREASAITLANEMFAVRFGLGPPALAFRVDVHNSIQLTATDVVHSIFDGCQIQGCYPRPLIDAHQASSFFFQDVQALTADLVARTGAIPKEDPSMGWMFQPFGAFGK